MKKRRRRFRMRYDKTFGLLLISPWLLGLVLFKLLPILASLGLSFTDFYMLEPGETRFIGLDNYARLFRSEAVGYILFATIRVAMTTIPLQLVASTLLAALLNSPRLKASTQVRTLFFLPSIIPSVAIVFMWFGFVDPNTGWLNRFILQPLGLLGFNDVFSDAAVALLFTISSLWGIGPGMLIMLGAMQGLSPEIQEAARVDGAGPLVRFFRITLPMISPAIFFSLVINLIAVFGGVILLDRGNAFSGSISPFDGYVSYMMFDQWQLGYAASLAWFFFVLVMAAVVVLFTTSRRWVYYPDLEN
ncbi:MAG: sugar ABC transporter permease [Chloroflexi bacterium]|nr:sugar ABC transporter permease [Chloroflexota bacterium]MCI0576861.1 sugar ABC transporter permease [Chloroflexota bacterium]MCI0645119.1 sugar ABC transporter permease [Chloroflexota bacterium]MCI0730167.1 sugar ABC transporter permease [Chloroflexota bacterium]